MNKFSGFTLVEMLVVVAILSILATLALPSYFEYVRKRRLYEAQSMMLDNAKFLEQFYSRKFSFKQNSTTWAEFPKDQQETQYFCIKMQGNPRGAARDHYTMKAVAKNKTSEPRVIIINDDQQIMQCESSTSHCGEKNFFSGAFSRTDKNCKFL